MEIFSIRNILVFGFIFSLLCTYQYIDFSSNSSLGVGYVYVAKSLVLSQNFNITEYWGNAGFDVIKTFDEYYTAYAPMASVFIAIPYAGLQIIYYLYTNFIGPINGGVSILIESITFSLTNTLAYVSIGYLLARILRKHEIETTKIKWVLVSYLFGSILLNYSVSFLNHVFTAFFILAAFYFSRYTQNQNRGYLLAGIMTGIAFLTEYPTILFSLAFFSLQISRLISTKDWKNFFISNLIFAIPVAVSILMLGIYNWVHFENPLLTAEGAIYEQNILTGVTTYRFEQNMLFGIWGFYFSPMKGLFLISPALLLGFYGMWKYLKVDKDGFILAGSYVLIMTLLYSMWSDCFGATPFGPRYLSSLIPFWFIFAAFGLVSKWLFNLFKALSLYGIYICVSNVFDGLPSMTWFNPAECKVMQYASFHKANDFWRAWIDGSRGPAIAIYKYIFGGKEF